MRTTLQPGLVGGIVSDPFAGTSDPLPFRAYEVLSVGFVVSEEEGVKTGANFFLERFYRSTPVSSRQCRAGDGLRGLVD